MSEMTRQTSCKTPWIASLVTFSSRVSRIAGAHEVSVAAQWWAMGEIQDLDPEVDVGMMSASMYGVNMMRICDRTSAACSVTFLEPG